MNIRPHFKVSFVKSCVRFTGCVFALLYHSVIALAVFLLLAEVLGILEEIVDNRG